jgi:phosphohistidine phosphatase
MTTRTLVLLRHAKAERPEGYPADIDRPLSERGRADAAAAGRWLVEAGLVPDHVLCSPSVRTRETWLSAAPIIGQISIGYERSLYSGSPAEMIELIRETGPTVAVLLVIGHNPTVSFVSMGLDPHSGAGEDLRTAGLAVHRFEGTWAELESGKAPRVAEHTARG